MLVWGLIEVAELGHSLDREVVTDAGNLVSLHCILWDAVEHLTGVRLASKHLRVVIRGGRDMSLFVLVMNKSFCMMSRGDGSFVVDGLLVEDGLLEMSQVRGLLMFDGSGSSLVMDSRIMMDSSLVVDSSPLMGSSKCLKLSCQIWMGHFLLKHIAVSVVQVKMSIRGL